MPNVLRIAPHRLRCIAPTMRCVIVLTVFRAPTHCDILKSAGSLSHSHLLGKEYENQQKKSWFLEYLMIIQIDIWLRKKISLSFLGGKIWLLKKQQNIFVFFNKTIVEINKILLLSLQSNSLTVLQKLLLLISSKKDVKD